MGRMAAHSGRRSFQATNLVTFRMWWTTHSCTSVCWIADSTAFRRPVNPSPHRMRMSCKPRAFEVIEDLQPEASAFGFLDPQTEHFLFARKTHAEHRVHAFLEDAFVRAYGYAQAVHKEDRVHVFERPVVPLYNLLLQFVGGTRDEPRRHPDAHEHFAVQR